MFTELQLQDPGFVQVACSLSILTCTLGSPVLH